MKRWEGVACWWVATAVLVGTGWGATIAVNTFDPAVVADGSCSLIEAMVNANDDAATHVDCSAGTGADSIELPAGTYRLREPYDDSFGASGLPAVTGDLRIVGAVAHIQPGSGQDRRGAIIQRDESAPGFRLLYVTRGARLVLDNLTITGGAPEPGFHGGGILNLGGDVVLHRCQIQDNEARFGGGLMNQSGSALLVDSVVSGNRSAADGGGVANRAGSANATLVAFGSSLVGNSAGGNGGALSNHASNGSTGSLELVDSTVADNRADSHGGGISQFGTAGSAGLLRMIGGEISGNVAGGFGGGICTWAWSPDPWSSTIDIRSARVAANQALGGGGGGIFAWNDGASLIVAESTVDANLAGNGRGGGLAVGAGAVLELQRSTISHNVAEGRREPAGSGGGVEVSDATATIELCTISGNRAMRSGGGIWVATNRDGGETGASAVVADCTLYENEAQGLGGGVSVERYSGAATASVQIVGSIAGRNLDRRGAGNCAAAYPAELSSDGHNLFDDVTCGHVMAGEGGGAASPGDPVVSDLMLSGLDDFGGPTLTHMPLDGSPAIDFGSGGGSRSAVDQRGYARVADGNSDGGCTCDGGAVEAGSPVPQPPRDTPDEW